MQYTDLATAETTMAMFFFFFFVLVFICIIKIGNHLRFNLGIYRILMTFEKHASEL